MRSKKKQSSGSRRLGASPPSSLRHRKHLRSSPRLYEKLDPEQKTTLEWVLKRKSAALFGEQGTGKTWVTGALIDELCPSDTLLIVILTNKDSTWVRFFREQLPWLNVTSDFDEYLSLPKPRLLLLHQQQLTPLKNTKRGKKIDWRFVKRLAKHSWSLIAIDEAQGIKNRQSLQSKAAARLRNSAERKLILSGTPVEQAPQDLWAQFRFLNDSIFGTDYAAFEGEFMEPLEDRTHKFRRGSWLWQRAMRQALFAKSKRKFNEEMLPEFLSRIKSYALRVTKDSLNLEPLVLVPVPVVMTGSHRKLYDDMKRDMVGTHKGTTIMAPLKITQKIKLHQICGGYLFDEEGEVHEVGTVKLRRTIKLVHDAKKPVVIWCAYLEEVWALHDELVDDYRVETLTGKTKKGKERLRIQTDFQKGKIDVLICQIKTGGVGIDLFRSHIGILYSFRHSSIDFDQAVSRLHRRGQNKKVTIYLPYCVGTIDEEISEAIVSKRLTIKSVLNPLRRRHGQETEGRPQVRSSSTRQGTRHRAALSSRRAA